MITIKEAITKKELKQFIKFPFTLYKDNKYWVPPIIKDELASFDKTKNPVFKQATANFYVAIKNKKIVGRVVAIINNAEINQNIKKMRFGWLDFIDDLEVSKALFNHILEIGKQNKLTFLEGPVGFSSMDKVGVLTHGFDQLGTMITWYNHKYYKTHFESFGFTVEKEFLESKILLSNIHIEKYAKFATLIKKRYQLKALYFTSSNAIMPYVDKMFELHEKAYESLSSFVKIPTEQIAYFKKKYIPFINPEYIKFILDKDDNLIAFAILMPYFAKALQKANGKLFPFGIYHLLKAKKKNDTAVSYLIGVDPAYQNKGVTAIIFEDFYNSVTKNGVKNLVLTPQLKDNEKIHKIWKNFKPTLIKKRCTYKLDIS